MALSNLTYDPALVAELAASFGLRKANTRALHALTARLAQEDTSDGTVVMDMATGAGKTYVMAAFIEYLRRQGHRNVMVVTPGLVVQKKTVANFTAGSPKYIAGAPVEANVITPDNYTTTHTTQADFTESGASNIYVFNVQQLIAPSSMEGETKSGGKQATARGIRKFSEYVGVLYDDLAALDDLVILQDEHHLYSEKAKAYNTAIRELAPAASVGFTASPDKDDDVVFRYTLREAIADKSVKQPVIAYRKDGYGENGRYQQLKDALALLDVKARHYEVFSQAHPDVKPITPVMLVVCEDIARAKVVEEMLVSPDFFGDPYAVLRVDSDSMTEEKATLLDELDSPDSPVCAVVSVNKLKEGWDTRSIAVMVTLRAMDSEILTQQTLGRGLRLPFGKYTEEEAIDTLDVVAHDSFRRLLDSEKVLRSFGVEKMEPAPEPGPEPEPETDPDTGAKTDAGTGEETSLPPEPNTAAETNPGTGADTGLSPEPGTNTGTSPGPAPETKLREIGGGGTPVDKWHPKPTSPAVVEIMERFHDVSFLFPHTTRVREDTYYSLSKLPTSKITQTAYAVTDLDSAVMERYRLNFTPHTIAPERLKQQTVAALEVDSETVRKELKTTLLHHRLIERNSDNIDQIDNRILPQFLNAVPLTSWTVDTLAVAASVLNELIDREVNEFAKTLRPVVKLCPLTMPREHRKSYTLPLGKTIEPRPRSGEKYVRYQYYSGWTNNLYNAAAFDSESGEAKLACDLDVSPGVEWWTRLYREDGASIAYGANSTYHPDFIVRDTDGRTWIVEGKDERGRTDEDVQRKRDAAEEAINLMAADPAMRDLKVGYVIAYEKDIRESGTWKKLLAVSSPVTSPN